MYEDSTTKCKRTVLRWVGKVEIQFHQGEKNHFRKPQLGRITNTCIFNLRNKGSSSISTLPTLRSCTGEIGPQNIWLWKPMRSMCKKALEPSVQFSCSVMSNSLQPHELQHARPFCPSPSPRVHPNSCLSSRWCHPAISSSVVPFSSCQNPSQHQGLSQWVNSLHEVAKVLEFQLQHWSFQWTPTTDLR